MKEYFEGMPSEWREAMADLVRSILSFPEERKQEAIQTATAFLRCAGKAKAPESAATLPEA